MTEKIEKLAALAHEMWMNWSKEIVREEYVSTARRHRWAGLWRPYEELPDVAKHIDRAWARKMLEVIENESS